jgi:group I intron endonuclease
MLIIYTITNLVNNKQYVGSTVDFNRRKRQHLSKLRNNKHHSIKLQRAWNKYGEDKFEFIIVFSSKNINNQIKIEQYFIDLFNPNYNTCKAAGSTLGIKQSKETKEKKSLSMKYQYAIGARPRHTTRPNYKHSEETKNKISINNEGKIHSLNTIVKMKLAKQKKCHQVSVKHIDTSISIVYNSKHDASKAEKLDRKDMNIAIRNNTSLKGCLISMVVS